MSAYSDEILAESGLQAYYRLNDPSGTTAEDASPNNKDGTYVNTPTLGVAGALINDPTDDAITLAAASSERVNLPTLTIGTTGSFECWFKRAAVTGVNKPMFSIDRDGGWCVGIMGSWSGSEEISFHATNVGQVGGTGAFVVTDTLWHHLVATADGTNYAIYVDGELEGTGAFGAALTSGTTQCALGTQLDGGGTYAPYGEYWDGSLDEVAIYNVALTPTQVGDHYDIGISLPVDLVQTFPDGDVNTTGWTSTPLHSKLNDASDATYITGTLS